MHPTPYFLLFLIPLAHCTAVPIPPQSILDVQQSALQEVEIIQPHTEQVLSWEALMGVLDESDVILLGEQHDHVVGHALQLRIVSEILSNYPQSILALEMLERDEQVFVEDYKEGLITKEVFTTLTHSKNWSGPDTWMAWYQPIIDKTFLLNGCVLAANAPRRYTRLARTEGFEAIDALPSPRRDYVDYPKELSGGSYKDRFWELGEHDAGEELMLGFYRAQQVWDATMASSIANANPTREKKVVLLVGQFHVEFEGGVVQELQKLIPNAVVTVVTIHPTIPEEDWGGDSPIADVLIVENR